MPVAYDASMIISLDALKDEGPAKVLRDRLSGVRTASLFTARELGGTEQVGL